MKVETGKEVLRIRLKDRRNSLSATEVENKSHAICTFLSLHPAFLAAGTLGAYLPIAKEVDPRPLFPLAVSEGKNLFLPWLEHGNRRLSFVPYRPGFPLERGPFGIMQPLQDGSVSPVRAVPGLDLLLLPLLGFAATGYRLGFGGGYYDRFLEKVESRPFLLGLAYNCQQVDELPVESHDIPLDGVVTESGVRLFSGMRTS
ncbi:MAG: 5-formyltetrahydrofolate cyclo-ligase [Magnetococcales bacterium]|nr:5-formyltetrahydrofolate cyclo-ligase [Magnetococcales bacterium]